ncbi:SDR family NAD(P)-dependent oxidoreductase [Streptomyces chryseus]
MLGGIGLACDGHGKSIAAPSSAGQRRAIQRAWSTAGVAGSEIDWVLAHGTGTLVGDRVEIETLSGLVEDSGLVCSSNKSVLGHAGWASGGVSVIHALLALQHGTIPAQQRFSVPHPALASSGLRVPTTAVPWPARAGRIRRVGVSSFGLGGANAHVVLQDGPGSTDVARPSLPQADDPAVLIGWSTWLPGGPSVEEVRVWLASGKYTPVRSFGDRYPASPFAVTKLPPIVTEVIDRSHLMALDVAYRFVAEHGELWAGHRETTGVIAAQSGLTRSWHDAVIRAASGDLESLPLDPADRNVLTGFLDEVRARQLITEETFAGSAPSIAANRITNRWDLHGPTMTIDAGADSAQAAVHTACQYLDSGELDIALVLCINESSTREAAEFAGRDEMALAEGAFLLAFTRESLAHASNWPVLGRVQSGTGPGEATMGGENRAGVVRDYLGAQGAVELLRNVLGDQAGRQVRGTPPIARSIEPPAGCGSQQQDTVPERDATFRGEVGVSRWAVGLRRDDLPVAPTHTPALGIPRLGVVLVSSAALAGSVAAEAREQGATILSTDPATDPNIATSLGEIGSESDLAPLLDGLLEGRAAQVLILADAADAAANWPAGDPALTRLLELSVVVTKYFYARLQEGTGSLTFLLRDPLTCFQVHPEIAQFTGFARSLAREIPQQHVLTVITDAGTTAALTELSKEMAGPRDRLVVYYRRGLRHTEQLCPAPLPAADVTPDCLEGELVVVAVGGARGVTSVVLDAMARRGKLKVWLLGRTDPTGAPEEILQAADSEQARLRAEFIATGRQRKPGATIADLNRTFERHWRSREAAATVRRLRGMCGADRVHYLVCDTTDADAVRQAAAEITSTEGRVDLLIHAACHQEAATLSNKPLSAFRQGLAAKVTSYRNLKMAFSTCVPRIWVNFGSALGTTGFPGETDYAAANEFLSAAARYGSRLGEEAAITIGWGLWEETGKVAGDLERDRLRIQGVSSGMTDAEGAAFFFAELASPRSAEPAPVYMTAEDREQAGARWPGFIASPGPAEPDSIASGLLGAPEVLNSKRARWHWSVDPIRDRYLREHLVDGRPCLPGAAIIAMAMEAAARLLPSIPVRSVQDVTFSGFIWADPASPGPTKYRIEAEVTAEPGAAGEGGRVQVHILSDVTARSGRVLERDRLHASMTVLTGQLTPVPPVPATSLPMTRHTDPHTDSEGAVRLTGIFRNLTDIRSGPHDAWARWAPVLAPSDNASHATIPVLLLDALFRLNCYPLSVSDTVQSRVPKFIRQVDFYTLASDTQLATRWPEGIELRRNYGTDKPDEYVAVTPDGDSIMRFTGMEGDLVDQVHVTVLPFATSVPPSPAQSAAAEIHPATSRCGGLPYYEMEHLVTFSDTTAAGIVYYAKLIEWMGACREQAAFALFPIYAASLGSEATALTLSVSCQYSGEIGLYDRISVCMTIPRLQLNLMESRYYIYRHLDNGERQLIAQGEQIVANVEPDGDSYTPARWNDEVLAGLEYMETDTGRASTH